jgi:transcription factor C subunit 6
MYQLPAPSVHHRHRAVPLFTRTCRVERLVALPQTFAPAKTVPTNNLTHSPAITDRVTKAWGYNVGPGPLWELVEDRSWFKESQPEGGEVDQEAYHRLIVYEKVCVKAGWRIMHAE